MTKLWSDNFNWCQTWIKQLDISEFNCNKCLECKSSENIFYLKKSLGDKNWDIDWVYDREIEFDHSAGRSNLNAIISNERFPQFSSLCVNFNNPLVQSTTMLAYRAWCNQFHKQNCAQIEELDTIRSYAQLSRPGMGNSFWLAGHIGNKSCLCGPV